MANRTEAVKPGPEANGAADGAEKHDGKGAAPKGGAMGAWLPLILNIVLMPAIAFGFSKFYLIPQVKKIAGGPAEAGHEEKEGEHGGEHGKEGAGPKGKVMVPLGGKVLVNLAGTMGTRYLLASMTLVSSASELKAQVEGHDAQLRDAAAGILSSKTISDLEKPGARNLIRTELISAFNEVLGKSSVSEIYLTEFAIQ